MPVLITPPSSSNSHHAVAPPDISQWQLSKKFVAATAPENALTSIQEDESEWVTQPENLLWATPHLAPNDDPIRRIERFLRGTRGTLAGIKGIHASSSCGSSDTGRGDRHSPEFWTEFSRESCPIRRSACSTFNQVHQDDRQSVTSQLGTASSEVFIAEKPLPLSCAKLVGLVQGLSWPSMKHMHSGGLDVVGTAGVRQCENSTLGRQLMLHLDTLMLRQRHV